MAEFFARNLDYVNFIFGLSFILLAALCRVLLQDRESRLPWKWLGLFGFLHGLTQWLDMAALSQGDSLAFLTGRLVLRMAAFVALLEFGRRALVRRGGEPVFGTWFIPALAVLVAWANPASGLDGLDASTRYALAIPGGLLAAAVLALAVRGEPDRFKRGGLVLAAACFACFGFTEIVPPRAPLGLASWLNDRAFFAATGMPIQVLRALFMVGIMSGLWIYRIRHPGETVNRRGLPWLPPLVFLTLLMLGWTAAEWRGRNRDREQRDRLLEQASALSRAIHPDDARWLSAVTGDRHNPRVERLHQQLLAASRILPCRGIFTLSLRNGEFVHGPQTYGINDPLARSPGSVYRSDGLEPMNLLYKREPFITDLTRARGEPLITAYAPVSDPRTGRVLMNIGLDVRPAAWNSRIARARLPPILGVMMLLLTLLIGIDAISRRDRLPPDAQGAQRHLESMLVFICAMVITGFAALLTHEADVLRRHSIFNRLADSRTSQIRDEINAIRGDLFSLARFFESSEDVTRGEFATFAGSMVQTDAVEAFGWVPLVPGAGRAPFEQDAALAQGEPYEIWERLDDGSRSRAGARPFHYPLLFIEPHAGNHEALGFDLGTEPGVLQAIRQSVRTGLWIATPALTLVHQPVLKAAMILLHPVTRGGSSAEAPAVPEVAGFTMAMVRYQDLLMRASSRAGLGERFLNINLVDLTDRGGTRLLAAHPETQSPPIVGKDGRPFPLLSIQPLFAFGRTFVVASHPSDSFLAAYPLNGSLLVGACGVLLGLLLTLFVAFLRNRQWRLEHEVQQRTAALRESQENLAVTLNSIGDGVIATDEASRVRRMNPAAERLTGWTIDEAAGRPLSDIFPIINARTREPVSNPVDRVAQSGEIVALTNHTSLIARDGTERQIADSAAPIRDPVTGAITGVVLVFSDVTREYAARMRLEESELQYRLLAEHASDIIGRLSPDGAYQYLSPGVATLLGYRPGELIGQSCMDLVHPDDLESVTAAFNQMRGRPEGAAVILRHRHRDGSWRWFETTGKRVVDPDTEQAREIIIVSRDITERKTAEDNRLEMERRLLHTQKLESLGVLTGGIAHDFNNLLTAVLGNLEMAAVGLTGQPAAQRSVENAIHATRRASDLTRQMLAYSGKGLFVIADIDLNALVEENAHMLKAAISKTVTLNLALAPGVPAIRADAGQIQQIIMNLITNASEAIGEKAGAVTLSTGFTVCDAATLADSLLPEKAAPGPFAWIEVADTGCGMAPETVRRVFEPFFTTKFTGRGLGMSAVLGIVRGHKGAIRIGSELGRGTRVRVLFPARPKPAAEPARPAAEPPRPPAEPPQPAAPGTPRGTILVVDDEQIVRDMCSAFVAMQGWKPLSAGDGEEGVRMFREHADEIDAVLLDLTMPRMDGATAFREIRRIRPGVPVILSSGHAEQEAFRRFDSEGVAGFLQKPYTLAMLKAELERLRGTLAP